MFVIAIGGDGAPICGTSFLVSFLNVGERLTSSDENWLLFGTDESETANVVRNYVYRLVSDLEHLESTVFQVKVDGVMRKVEFRVGELPNDMKFLYFLAGEISNNARFFSTFATVRRDDLHSKVKKFGPELDAVHHVHTSRVLACTAVQLYLVICLD